MPEETFLEQIERRIVTGHSQIPPKLMPKRPVDNALYTPDPKTSTTAVRFNEGKRDWSLMPMGSVEEILKVLEFGKQKYDAWNWSRGEGFKYSSVYNSLMRHLIAWNSGEDLDPESGLSHMAHIGCNVLFLLHFINNKDKYPNNDDRALKN